MESYRFILPYARRYWAWYLAGILVAPISAAATLGIPWITGRAVEKLRVGGATAEALLHPAAPRVEYGWSWIPNFGLIPDLIALSLVAGLSLFAVRWLIIGASRHVEYDLRNALFRHLQRLDRSFYADARTGDIMSRATLDVERTRLLIGPIVMYASRTFFILLFGVPLMLSLSGSLMLMVMVPLSLMSIAVRLIGPKVHREALAAQEIFSELSSTAQEDFSGARVVKSFVLEDTERRRFDGSSVRYLEQSLRAVRVAAWMHPLIGLVGDLALISLLVIGGHLIISGRLEFEDFVTFAGYQAALLWPMLSIGWVVNQYQRARASVDRLRQLFRTQPRVRDPEEPRSPPSAALRGDLSIRGLTFTYGGTPVLQDIDIDAPAGTTVAIIGRTGAGKSTLVQLIPRVLPTPPGTIFIDGIDVCDLSLETLRRSIGYVPQDSFLFSRTVEENIRFGADGTDEHSLWAASRAARFDKDIDQFPRGYREMVGERGVTLSGGQKQRASLARALLMQPRILVLDDAFSAVDTETEEEILSNLRESTEGVTKIVVSHRVSSIAHADRIYVLDQGRVVESGTHRELLRHGGIYAEIHRIQRLSAELESM